MKDALKLIAALLFVAALIVGGCALSVAHWRECRREHPWWYCLGGGGK